MTNLLRYAIVVLLGGLAVSAQAKLVARVEVTPAGPVLQVNGKAAAPTIFFVNFDTDEKLRPLQLREIETAGKHGVNIVSFPVQTPWPNADGKYDYRTVDHRVEAALKANPDMLVIPRIGVSWPPEWWTVAHPDELMLYDDGKRGIPSAHSRPWRDAAFQHTRTLVAHLEERFGEHMLGYHPCGQHTGEWFYDRSWEGALSGFEPPARAAFKDYVRRKYGTDAALRSGWADPDATLDGVGVPSARDQSRSLAGAFRDPVAERRVIDFFEFRNVEMADAVELMCRAVKEAAPDKLAVTFYGYHLELAALPRGLQTGGHLSLGRLLESPYVDVLCSPVSYTDRTPGGGGYFMAPVDSVQLHGKLWLVEDDTRTHLGESDREYALQKTKDARETNGVLQRNFAHVATRGAAIWWMDLFGVGWFDGDGIWQDLGDLKRIYESGMHPSRYSPEIAVIVDERSALYARPSADPLGLLDNASRRQWYHIGAPVGIYLLDDLVAGRVPPAKMYLLPDAFRLDRDQIDGIRKHACRKGVVVVWMYAPGVVRGGSLAVEHIGDVTGMAVEEIRVDDPHIVLAGTQSRFAASNGNVPSVFAVSDAAAEPLARYGDGVRVAIGAKAVSGWTSVYSGVPMPPAALLRDLARRAGVHIYNYQDDVVMVGNGLVAIHAASTGEKTLTMPRECRLVDAVTGADLGRSREFRFEMTHGDSRLLLVPE